jgi:hypothetical protein
MTQIDASTNQARTIGWHHVIHAKLHSFPASFA